ncbi:MAG TPA: hypothetical protein VEJ67_10855 [Candidatus Cybelea sp.]|nr:hypothetical protein [Candidatus Cybelea sp.]
MTTERRLIWVGCGATMMILLSCAVTAAGAWLQSDLPEQQSGVQPQSQGQSPSQAQPTAQQPEQQTKQTGEQKNIKKEETEGVSNDRLFYTLPNFLTIADVNHVPRLSTKQKFKVVAQGTFDWVQYPWNAFLAAISQAENSEPGYGQGWAAYGKRFGAAFGDGAIENFWTGAILPSVLRQDPRFYQLGEGGFWHRTGYAVSRIFVTRTDSGNETFNASEIFGSAIAAGISTYTYHPRTERTLSNTGTVWGTQVGLDTLTMVTKEFWPDIHRKINKMRRPEQ